MIMFINDHYILVSKEIINHNSLLAISRAHKCTILEDYQSHYQSHRCTQRLAGASMYMSVTWELGAFHVLDE